MVGWFQLFHPIVFVSDVSKKQKPQQMSVTKQLKERWKSWELSKELTEHSKVYWVQRTLAYCAGVSDHLLVNSLLDVWLRHSSSFEK